MVEAVRLHFKDVSITPTNFYFEKFNNAAAPADSPAASAEESAAGTYEIGEEHLPVTESDAQFDARMALELGAMELTIGRLTPAQLTEYRILAENSAASIDRDHFTDAAAFTETNALFHDFLFRCTGNEVLLPGIPPSRGHTTDEPSAPHRRLGGRTCRGGSLTNRACIRAE